MLDSIHAHLVHVLLFKAAPFLCSDIEQKKDIEEVLILNARKQILCIMREKC